ncbi:hypothetical protein [Marinoscillum sp. MHG1-6]|uniref:hypothetical protein n=1 Tax=Marinoscillum sp. MHG1-6 TaxID=2959627 RepID=UPI0021583941|nr:hypothetical protein [Marinoscillum sp. MHG1-6]
MNQEAYYLCYATANESKMWSDFRNMLMISHHAPGVNKIKLFLAISEVNKNTKSEQLFEKWVRKLFRDHPFIELVRILRKDNKGRDFSSYEELHKAVSNHATDNDYLFFLNRSAYGPFYKNWYSAYIDQYTKYPDVGLCGATINLMTHKSQGAVFSPHVQTYAFLTQMKKFDFLLENFPGTECTDRIELIVNGEVKLSRKILERNMALTCMENSEWRIDANTVFEAPEKDPKEWVQQKHHFYHRKYLRRHWSSWLSIRRKLVLLGIVRTIV